MNSIEPSRQAVWDVAALLSALAQTLAAQFNPVAVAGELSGFTRAASGHCYFTLKDASGQEGAGLRCALFRRQAQALNFAPRDGLRVEAVGKLDVYGPRGDLQLIVEHLQSAGQGVFFEQFARLKAQLSAEGWFDPARKRPLPDRPKSLALVTSLGAAALADVATALARRVPHLPVTLYPCLVQGDAAPASIRAALERAYQRYADLGEGEVLLLVRGGGSMEDLWAFNDPDLVRLLGQAPMPVISGVGHETDFTLSDFVADLRAPTPTAAAELCARATADQIKALDDVSVQLLMAAQANLAKRAQSLDQLSLRLARPTAILSQEAARCQQMGHRLRTAVQQRLHHEQNRVERLQSSLQHLNPKQVLDRGFAYLTDSQGRAIGSVKEVRPAQSLAAVLADGRLHLSVQEIDA